MGGKTTSLKDPVQKNVQNVFKIVNVAFYF